MSNLYQPVWTKASPKGIDYWIQRLQIDMYNYILTKYSLSQNGAYACYGRVYRNYDNAGGYLPHAFKKNIAYAPDVFFDDRRSAVSFFDIGETIKVNQDNLRYTAKVQLYFFVNLVKMFPDDITRMDEELRNDIVAYVNTKYGFLVSAIHVGIKKVMSEYSGKIKTDIQIRNMQPRYAFCIDMEKKDYNPLLLPCTPATASGANHEFAPDEFAPGEFA